MTVINWDDDITVHAEMDDENRYLLKAIWSGALPNITFIMLNPSVGRMEHADLTLKKCLKFAKSWGYGSMDIVNLFSQISTDSKNLKIPSEEELLKNNLYIRQAVQNSGKVVLAWGEQKTLYRKRVNEVLNIVPLDKQYCIEKSKSGKFPKHPLYLKEDLQLIPWNE